MKSGGQVSSCIFGLGECDFHHHLVFGYSLVLNRHRLFFDQSYVNGVGRLIQPDWRVEETSA